MRKPKARTLSAWSALMVAHRRICLELDAELREELEMTLDEYETLTQLRRSRRPLPMSELAERVLVSRATLTRLVDNLVDRGWVERWYDDVDRRRVLVELTKEGRDAQVEAAEYYLDGVARMVQRPLRDHDLETFGAALDALVEASDEANGHSSQRT